MPRRLCGHAPPRRDACDRGGGGGVVSLIGSLSSVSSLSSSSLLPRSLIPLTLLSPSFSPSLFPLLPSFLPPSFLFSLSFLPPSLSPHLALPTGPSDAHSAKATTARTYASHPTALAALTVTCLPDGSRTRATSLSGERERMARSSKTVGGVEGGGGKGGSGGGREGGGGGGGGKV